ncbi:MAG: hypothetical protein EHM72_03085, partial [Calditrichaeota bacterium]
MNTTGVNAVEKNSSSSFSVKMDQYLDRHPLWPTMVAAVLLLIIFHFPHFSRTDHTERPFLPVDRYLSLRTLPLWNPMVDSGTPALSNPQWVARMNVLDSIV